MVRGVPLTNRYRQIRSDDPSDVRGGRSRGVPRPVQPRRRVPLSPVGTDGHRSGPRQARAASRGRRASRAKAETRWCSRPSSTRDRPDDRGVHAAPAELPQAVQGEIGWIVRPDVEAARPGHGRCIGDAPTAGSRSWASTGSWRGVTRGMSASLRVMEPPRVRREAQFVESEFVKGEWVDDIICPSSNRSGGRGDLLASTRTRLTPRSTLRLASRSPTKSLEDHPEPSARLGEPWTTSTATRSSSTTASPTTSGRWRSPTRPRGPQPALRRPHHDDARSPRTGASRTSPSRAGAAPSARHPPRCSPTTSGASRHRARVAPQPTTSSTCSASRSAPRA